jgi:uncharacterized repeat protein (TIGR03803 family)
LTDTSTGLPGSSPVTPVDITSATVTTNNTDAVLLLSATGVCQAKITITASAGASSAVRTFMANAVDDSFSDPPFPAPVPNLTATNGSVSVPLEATDLQLDLIRYGYQTFLPVDDGFITSGTSPIITIPILSNTNTIGVLISNTDNTIGAEVDAWNGSGRGFAGVPFNVGAGAKPLTGSLTPIPAGTFGKLDLPAFPVALFTSGNPKDTATSFTASVNWGDSTLLSGSQVSIVKDGTQFKLVASHDYTHVGEFPVLVNISDPGGARLSLTGTANIAPSAIAISGTDIVNTGGAVANEIVATFKDLGAASTAADYAATINWGDGSVSPGVVKSGPGSTFEIVGSHVYRTPEIFTVSVSVARTGTNGYSASTWLAAHISGVTAPQVFPPFPQAHLAQIWTTIYTDSNAIFTTGSTGGNPFSGLVRGPDGYLYGTTEAGGADNDGTVYRLTTTGSLGTVYSFTGGNDGANPYAALVQAGTNGDLYGTAETSGTYGEGTIYKITSSGSFSVLYSFTGGDDGGQPYSALVAGTNGNLYGTNVEGGSSDDGTVYEISTSGSFNTLHAFTGNPDGAYPYAALVAGTDGNFYGTTVIGGTNNAGAVYKITPGGTENTLYSFTTGTTGESYPYAALVRGTNGYFYGTTSQGGASGDGTVFEITSSGTLTTLHSFSGDDGEDPRAALALGNDGNFYGTTVTSGTEGYGTVFEISPSPGGSFTPLHTFTSGKDGMNPYATLLKQPGGGFYGTTELSGAHGYGTVFSITADGTLTTFDAFGSGASFQIAVRGGVAIINSGDKPSRPGSFSVYVDANATLDGDQTAFSSEGRSSFPIPALNPGAYNVLTFYQEGSVVDTRLKLPVGFLPSGESMIGVVTYSDPVGDFDGSQKIISPFQFSPQ